MPARSLNGTVAARRMSEAQRPPMLLRTKTPESSHSPLLPPPSPSFAPRTSSALGFYKQWPYYVQPLFAWVHPDLQWLAFIPGPHAPARDSDGPCRTLVTLPGRHGPLPCSLHGPHGPASRGPASPGHSPHGPHGPASRGPASPGHTARTFDPRLRPARLAPDGLLASFPTRGLRASWLVTFPLRNCGRAHEHLTGTRL